MLVDVAVAGVARVVRLGREAGREPLALKSGVGRLRVEHGANVFHDGDARDVTHARRLRDEAPVLSAEHGVRGPCVGELHVGKRRLEHVFLGLRIVRVVGVFVAGVAVNAVKPAERAADARALVHLVIEAQDGRRRIEIIVGAIVHRATALGGKTPRVGTALTLRRERALHGAEAAGLDRHAATRSAGAALGAQRYDAAHGLAAVERALRTVSDLERVARTDARAAEIDLVVGVRIVDPDAVDEEEGLVGIRAAQKERRHRAVRARGEQRRTGDATERTGQRVDLAAREIGGRDDIDRRADVLRIRGSACRRGDERRELCGRGLSEPGRKRGERADCAKRHARGKRGRRRTRFHGCVLLGAKSRTTAVAGTFPLSRFIFAMKFSRTAARKVRDGTREFPRDRCSDSACVRDAWSRRLASAFIGLSRLAVLPLARDGGL